MSQRWLKVVPAIVAPLLLGATSVQAQLFQIEMPAVAGQRWWLAQGWDTPYGETHHIEPAWDFNWSTGSSDMGMPVVAAGDGVVCLSEVSRTGYGRVVIVHYGSTTTDACDDVDSQFGRYAHLAAVAVTAGQKVRSGQVVGFIGGSGYRYVTECDQECHVVLGSFDENRWAPHLHYSTVQSETVRLDTTYVRLPMRFQRNDESSVTVAPPQAYVSTMDDENHYYTSRNDALWREAYERWGRANLGAPPVADTYLGEWFQAFAQWMPTQPDGSFAPDGVPLNYYFMDLEDEPEGRAQLIYELQ